MSRIMKRFFDIGANLTDTQFSGVYRGKQRHASDFEDMIARSRAAGCSEMLVTGSCLEESKAAIAVAEHHNFYATCGIHPCSAKSYSNEYYDELERVLEDGAKRGIVRAFGEFGLDYDRLHYADAQLQQQVFKRQLEMARKIELPLFLHMRAAADDFISILAPWLEQTGRKGVVHSFTGTLDELRRLLDLGLFIGINGCSLKTEENLAVAAEVPLDRLMLETDAPWCEIRPTHASHKYVSTKYESTKPEKYQAGKLIRGRAEPCQILGVAEVVSAVKQVPLEQVEQAAWHNAVAMFGEHEHKHLASKESVA